MPFILQSEITAHWLRPSLPPSARTDERGHTEETGRYIREHEDAKRTLAEMQEEQRQRELEEALERNDSLRDGPPPPKLGK